MVKNQQNGLDFGLIAFNINQIEEITKKIGLDFDRSGYLVSNKKTVHCNCCGKALKKKSIGNILPGSNIAYCDNPVCFADYMNKNLDF